MSKNGYIELCFAVAGGRTISGLARLSPTVFEPLREILAALFFKMQAITACQGECVLTKRKARYILASDREQAGVFAVKNLFIQTARFIADSIPSVIDIELI